MTTFVDERGSIHNVGHIAVITSKAGTVRSNHMHKEGWHFLYVVSGLMRYLCKSGEVASQSLVGPGDMVFTGPGVAHRTEFVEDTVLLSLASENQGPTHHDADLVKVEW